MQCNVKLGLVVTIFTLIIVVGGLMLWLKSRAAQQHADTVAKETESKKLGIKSSFKSLDKTLERLKSGAVSGGSTTTAQTAAGSQNLQSTNGTTVDASSKEPINFLTVDKEIEYNLKLRKQKRDTSGLDGDRLDDESNDAEAGDAESGSSSANLSCCVLCKDRNINRPLSGGRMVCGFCQKLEQTKKQTPEHCPSADAATATTLPAAQPQLITEQTLKSFEDDVLKRIDVLLKKVDEQHSKALESRTTNDNPKPVCPEHVSQPKPQTSEAVFPVAEAGASAAANSETKTKLQTIAEAGNLDRERSNEPVGQTGDQEEPTTTPAAASKSDVGEMKAPTIVTTSEEAVDEAATAHPREVDKTKESSDQAVATTEPAASTATTTTTTTTTPREKTEQTTAAPAIAPTEKPLLDVDKTKESLASVASSMPEKAEETTAASSVTTSNENADRSKESPASMATTQPEQADESTTASSVTTSSENSDKKKESPASTATTQPDKTDEIVASPVATSTELPAKVADDATYDAKARADQATPPSATVASPTAMTNIAEADNKVVEDARAADSATAAEAKAATVAIESRASSTNGEKIASAELASTSAANVDTIAPPASAQPPQSDAVGEQPTIATNVASADNVTSEHESMGENPEVVSASSTSAESTEVATNGGGTATNGDEAIADEQRGKSRDDKIVKAAESVSASTDKSKGNADNERPSEQR